MASGRSSYLARQNYRFLSTDRATPVMTASDSVFELDESDVWNHNSTRSSSPEFRKAFPSSRLAKKTSKRQSSETGGGLAAASSLPLNVPDWSKILRDDYRDNRWRESDGGGDFYGDDDDECDGNGDGGNRIPPHEFLAQQMARTRIASFSVHEGIGRTLKGRDLSRVRNAIWEKTGFQD